MEAKLLRRLLVAFVILLSIGLSLLFWMRRNSPKKAIIRNLTNAGYSERMARMIYAVAQHESGNFTSRLFKSGRNMFGMKMPIVRPTTASFSVPASEGLFAGYRSVNSGAKDFVLYLNYSRYPKDFVSVDELVNFMKSKKYFEADVTLYSNAVKRWYDS